MWCNYTAINNWTERTELGGEYFFINYFCNNGIGYQMLEAIG